MCFDKYLTKFTSISILKTKIKCQQKKNFAKITHYSRREVKTIILLSPQKIAIFLTMSYFNTFGLEKVHLFSFATFCTTTLFYISFKKLHIYYLFKRGRWMHKEEEQNTSITLPNSKDKALFEATETVLYVLTNRIHYVTTTTAKIKKYVIHSNSLMPLYSQALTTTSATTDIFSLIPKILVSLIEYMFLHCQIEFTTNKIIHFTHCFVCLLPSHTHTPTHTPISYKP